MTQPTDRPIMNLPVQEVFDNRNMRYQSTLASWFVAWAMTRTDATVATLCEGSAFGVAYALAGIMSDKLDRVGTTREMRAVKAAVQNDFAWMKANPDQAVAMIQNSAGEVADDPDSPSLQDVLAKMDANQVRHTR